MPDERQTIRNTKTNGLLKDEWIQLAALLIKAGYTVRQTMKIKPGKTTKETVIEYWEEET